MAVLERTPTDRGSESVTSDQHVQALAVIRRLFHGKYNAVKPAPAAASSKSVGSHRSKREAAVPSEVANSLVQHELARLIPTPTMKAAESKSGREPTRSLGSARQTLWPQPELPPVDSQAAPPTAGSREAGPQ
jgi:hypothetical protein